MRYAAGHAADTRARLVALAAATLHEHGVAAVGVQPLMRAAGMTHGGFYQHFASREALLAEAVGALFESRPALAPHPGDTPGEALRRFVQAYLSPAHAADVAGGCPLPALAGEARRLPADAAARYRAGVTRLEQRLAELLAAAGHAPALARALLAELAGAIMLARLEPDEAERERALALSKQSVLQRLEQEGADEAIPASPRT